VAIHENVLGWRARQHVDEGDLFDRYARAGHVIAMHMRQGDRLMVELDGVREVGFSEAYRELKDRESFR